MNTNTTTKQPTDEGNKMPNVSPTFNPAIAYAHLTKSSESMTVYVMDAIEDDTQPQFSYDKAIDFISKLDVSKQVIKNANLTLSLIAIIDAGEFENVKKTCSSENITNEAHAKRIIKYLTPFIVVADADDQALVDIIKNRVR